ncbi:PLDc N-terminal domain-containing protein [Arthrobacter sp. N199823]|uniref:PLDc N-terminal domain-containing protein n=1 Tax=Arthrobacter sp. N199823 TaxID=2058895 RepID=UPI000CE34A16|nr:PLDc N-terminal domain-containing protein [Arthrobacter sp. N199823]
MKKHWSELSTGRRCTVVVVGIAQLILQGVALRDIAKRTPAQVNGPKAGWVAASFINFFGPLAYFAMGRKKSD